MDKSTWLEVYLTLLEQIQETGLARQPPVGAGQHVHGRAHPLAYSRLVEHMEEVSLGQDEEYL